MKLVSIVGTRPHFPKAAMLSRALRGRHDEMVIHTGQHYDETMSDVFLRELGMEAPNLNLGVGSGSQASQTARMLGGIEKALQTERPARVLVYGDTNSTLAGALAASKLNIPVAHVEAGLRSGDRRMPEEINRVVTDHLSDLLFCPTASAEKQLQAEGIEEGAHWVGDLMYDSLLAFLPTVQEKEAAVLGELGLSRSAFYLATVHRAGNTNDQEKLAAIFKALSILDLPVVLPLHPRTKAALAQAKIEPGPQVRLLPPLGYLEMVALERNARAIITDSGGVQREAYLLQIPCVTLRDDTEWPETSDGQWNILAGSDPDTIVAAAKRTRPADAPKNSFGDGNAARKIVEILDRDSS